MMSVKTILLVENDPVSQTMYQKRLEREGFHMECAPDGQVALDILSERAPDLVLLDLMLPKVCGADVLKFMQADPRLTTVPVIIFSNAPLTEVPPDSPLAQGTRRLLKSDCTFSKLLDTIQETLAATPELVVVEANKMSSARTVAARKGGGESKEDLRDIVPAPGSDADGKIPKPLADFLAEAPTIMPKLREHSMGYIKSPDSEAGGGHLAGLHQRVHLLNTGATQAGCPRVALLMNTFDALLSGIKDKPSAVTPSVLQTIAQAVDCLDGLLKAKDGYSAGPAIHAKVLVVDDDTVCNHVNVTSLKRANFDADGVKDPSEALRLLESSEYELVVLDVNMPGMTGFDLCEKMRRLPHCKKTPVIFVTAFSSFDNRKQSVLSGGNDFVCKPVSPVELALKVAINLIKTRAQGSSEPLPQTRPAAINGSSQTPHPAAKTKNDRQISPEIPAPEPPSRLAPPPEPKPAPPASSRPAAPPKSAPASPRDNGGTPDNGIQERLRQSTAALEQAKAGLEQESAERTKIESQWREQLNAAKALIGQSEAVLKEKDLHCGRLEEELAGLRKAKDELQSKLAAEQQTAAKSQGEIKELQERVRQSTTELERAKTTWEQQSAQHTRVESELREQVNKAKAASSAAETAFKEKEARYGQLEKELAGLQQAREDLQNKFTAGQQTTEKLQHEIKELNNRLQQGVAEMERAKTTWEQQSAQHTSLESELREQVNKTKAASSAAESAFKEKEAWCGQLEKELAGLQQAREDLQNKFTAGQQTAEKLQQEIKELNGRLQQGVADMERAKAASGAAEAAFKEKEAQNARLEKELTGMQQSRDELQNKFAAEQQAAAKSRQEIKELNDRMQQAVAELERAKAGLEQETAKRTRLEGEHQNLVAAREALNLELRGLRESQATRDAELRDKQKKLAEGLRENIQLLQLKLQEAEALGGDANGARGKSNAR
ncbi:MAG TPA: response regulator [Candidatus Acidoferrales bacterium]|nr:response regulator [Candidatus Acidoferrales bacterium]